MPGVGFFGMLVIGFLAGWVAERTMNRDHGVLTNILVGIAGSFVGGTLAGLLGIAFYGFLGNLGGRHRRRDPDPLAVRPRSAKHAAGVEGQAMHGHHPRHARATRRARHPEKAHRPDQEVLRKPDWIRVKAPVSRGYAGDARDREVAQPRHRLRGGRLPEHRRVLGQEARHLHDHGRHLHARLRLLQRRHRHAGRARSERAGQRRPRRSARWASPMSSSPRSTATTSPTAAPRISPT